MIAAGLLLFIVGLWFCAGVAMLPPVKFPPLDREG